MRWRHPSSLQHVPPVPIHITVIGAVENQSGHACCRPIRCMLFQKDFEVVLREEPIRIFSDQVRYGFYSRHGECRFLRMLVTGKCCNEWVTDEGSQDDPVECGATESERVCEKMAIHTLARARGSEGVSGFRVSYRAATARKRRSRLWQGKAVREQGEMRHSKEAKPARRRP